MSPVPSHLMGHEKKVSLQPNVPPHMVVLGDAFVIWGFPIHLFWYLYWSQQKLVVNQEGYENVGHFTHGSNSSPEFLLCCTNPRQISPWTCFQNGSGQNLRISCLVQIYFINYGWVLYFNIIIVGWPYYQDTAFFHLYLLLCSDKFSIHVDLISRLWSQGINRAVSLPYFLMLHLLTYSPHTHSLMCLTYLPLVLIHCPHLMSNISLVIHAAYYAELLK